MLRFPNPPRFALLLTWSSSAWGQAQADSQPTEVVVQASPVDRSSNRDATAASYVIRRSDLNRPGASTASALSRTPGAQVQRSGGSSETATVSLRGGTTNQVPVYLGPFLLNDEITGAADLSTVPLFFIDRIEVFRGHAPEFVDRLGLGGAVVIEPMLPKRTQLFGALMLGSYGASAAAARVASGNETVGNVIGFQRATAANDYPYQNNGGTVSEPNDDKRTIRRNADAESFEVWNSGYLRPNRSTRMRWLLHGFEREQGDTGLAIIPAQHARSRIRRELGAVTTSVPCSSGWSLEDCQLELHTQFQQSHSSLDDPQFELGYGTDRVDSTSIRGSEHLRIAHHPLRQLRLGWLVGGDSGVLRQVNRSSDGLSATRRSAQVGIHSQLAITPRFAIVAVGRAATESTATNVDATRTDVLPSGRAGIHYRAFDAIDVRANVGRYVRVPTLAELYGISSTLRGNAELVAEHGVSEDVGFSSHFGKGFWQASAELVGYHQRIGELVAWERSSFGQIRPYNVGRARLMGIDISAVLDWKRLLRVEAILSLLDPRDVTPSRTAANDILPYRSRMIGTLRLDAWLPRQSPTSGIRLAGIGASIHHRSSRYAVRAGNGVLPNSTAVDIDGQLAFARSPIVLRGSITNLLDRQNYDLVGMPLPGRCYFLGVEMDWEAPR